MNSLHFGRQDFPALGDSRVVYLDSAATTQLPTQVIEAMLAYDTQGRGNPWRGIHGFAERADKTYAEARSAVAQFVGAPSEHLIFTKSTTEGLNLVARSVASKLGSGDEVLLTIFEHHANLLPWRELAAERGFALRYLPMSSRNTLDVAKLDTFFTPAVKVVVLPHVSNVTGAILPVADVVRAAQKVQALVIVDGAQAVAHLPVDVTALGVDAYAFGAHKMYGPSGIGALAVSSRLFGRLDPLLYGGGMVEEVNEMGTTYLKDVRLFEAGSPNVSGAVGFAAAAKLLSDLGPSEVRRHELELVRTLVERLSSMPDATIHGLSTEEARSGIVSFSLKGAHPHDVADILGQEGIAVRAGYHCAAPFTRCLAPEGTVRVSLGVYSEVSDVEKLVTALDVVRTRLSL